MCPRISVTSSTVWSRRFSKVARSTTTAAPSSRRSPRSRVVSTISARLEIFYTIKIRKESCPTVIKIINKSRIMKPMSTPRGEKRNSKKLRMKIWPRSKRSSRSSAKRPKKPETRFFSEGCPAIRGRPRRPSSRSRRKKRKCRHRQGMKKNTSILNSSPFCRRQRKSQTPTPRKKRFRSPSRPWP